MSLNVPSGHTSHTASEVYSFRIASNGGDVNIVPGEHIFVGLHTESEESVPSIERYPLGTYIAVGTTQRCIHQCGVRVANG